MPHQLTFTLKGAAPYSQSFMHDTPKLNKEAPDAYDARTWQEKAHLNAAGQMIIPAMAIKQALDEVAKYLGEKIPGKGQSTYSKHFRSGVLCFDNLPITFGGKPVTVKSECFFQDKINANSDGVRGSGKRVTRRFPSIQPGWEAKGTLLISDDVITPVKLEEYLVNAGNFIGIGRFRPANGGFYGRFTVEKFGA